MITGQVPHAGESPLSVAYQHVNSDVPPPSASGRAIPPDVDALVVTATRRDPGLRYQNAYDFLADVRRVRGTLPAPRPFVDAHDTLVVDTATAAELAASSPATGPRSPTAMPPRRPPGPSEARTTPTQPAAPSYRRSRTPFVVAGLLVLAVLASVLGGWYLASGPGRTVTMPPLAGSTVAQASKALAALDAELTVKVTEEAFSETVPAEEIISSDPPAGEGVRVGSEVGVVVSKGPERYAVPPLRGVDQAAVADALKAANLVPGEVKQAYDDKAPVGTVVSSDPKPGAEVKRDTPVDVVVSKGPKPVPVPSVAGKKASNARSALADAGLKVDVTQKYSETVADGVVISVKPGEGKVVDSGSTVDLVVSKGPPPVTVPKLVDMRKNAAINALKKLGLRVNVVESQFTPLDRVISQDPTPGTSIPKGSTVTIRII
jgi:beta-lactam-binding protein with PASTA domain